MIKRITSELNSSVKGSRQREELQLLQLKG